MNQFYIEYATAEREDNGRGPFKFETREDKRIGPIDASDVERMSVDLMGAANTIPHTVKVFEQQVKSVAEIIEEIGEALLEADGNFVQEIANQVLTHQVVYDGDSIFHQSVESPGLSDLDNLESLRKNNV